MYFRARCKRDFALLTRVGAAAFLRSDTRLHSLTQEFRREVESIGPNNRVHFYSYRSERRTITQCFHDGSLVGFDEFSKIDFAIRAI